MFIGAHISIAKGLKAAVRTAEKMEGNTFQFFTRNPRGGKAKKLDLQDIKAAHALMQEYSFGPLVGHAPYTFNLASAKPSVREFSLNTIKDDLQRIKQMGVPNLVLHVGSHGGQGEEQGLKLVERGLQEILNTIPEGVNILLEGMAGAGSELGYTFEHLGRLIAACDNHSQLAVCLDTCHLTGAGYDLQSFSVVKKEFAEKVGLDRLKALHLNDSKFPVASRKDRHEKLGEGYVGLDVIKNIVRDEDIQKIPIILETPNDNEGYAREIVLVKEMVS